MTDGWWFSVLKLTGWKGQDSQGSVRVVSEGEFGWICKLDWIWFGVWFSLEISIQWVEVECACQHYLLQDANGKNYSIFF